jgi:dihydrofolate reductase
MIEAIFAVDVNNGLAKKGSIPWSNKTDMKFFKEKTVNNIVIMGSKTFLSLPGSKPLPNRTNIVISNTPYKYIQLYNLQSSSMPVIFVSLSQCIDIILTNNYKLKKIFVIGENNIFKLLESYCTTIWLTTVKQSYECDLQLDINMDKYSKKTIYEDDEIIINKLLLL